MAKRITATRFNSEAVQGEGSFVVMSQLTVKEAKSLFNQSRGTAIGDTGETQELTAKDEQIIEVSFDTIGAHVVAWDWVDDNGDPLPLPKDDPGAIDLLNIDEVKFLAECLTGKDKAKNSVSGSKHT